MRGTGAAVAAIVLGLAALAAMPVGALVAQRASSIGLIQSLYGSVPSGAVLGLMAWAAGRRARFALDRSVTRDGAALVRVGRLLAWAGLYAAFIGGIALGVYAVLHYRQ
jgi:hypothetical protein